jgi:hypothetical protein
MFIGKFAYSFLLCPYLVLVSGKCWLHRMSLEAYFPFLLYRIVGGALVFFKSLIEFGSASVQSWTFPVETHFTVSISLLALDFPEGEETPS